MRSLLTLLVLLGVTLVQALSSKGSRLLAILDEVEDKATYSKFLGDLEGTKPLETRDTVPQRQH